MLTAVRAWILLSTFLVGGGWVLSAFHQLNRAGYGALFALAAVMLAWHWRKQKIMTREILARNCRKLFNRFKKPAPFLFLVLATMALVGGGLYACQNNDSNEYRIPRVWHWLAEGRWHWIHTLDDRMNIAGCGYEWLAAPLMLFSHTDRLFYLANWISYLLLPGLIFSVFRRLQVRPRVAWWWMWLLASGWCYAMQASSTVNDSFAVVYTLAAVVLALRGIENKSIGDLWLSMLAAGLLTGVKQTDIPLALLWLVAVLPGLRLMLNRPFGTVAVAAISLLVSAVPLFVFNFEHAGTLTGLPKNASLMISAWSGSRMVPSSPVWGIIGNTFALTIQNLQPPYLPTVNAWNDSMYRFIHTPLGAHFAGFESFGFMSPGVSEAEAGIGLGVFILTLISIWGAWRHRKSIRSLAATMFKWQPWLLRIVPWFALIVFMTSIASMSPARQIASYYVFLFPVILVGAGHASLVRRRWWQTLVLLVMVFTAGVLVVSRSKPLFPAKTIIVPIMEKHPNWKFLSRAWESYACRFSVETQREGFKQGLLRNETVVAYGTTRGSQEAGLWLPFGSRRIIRVTPQDNPDEILSKGVRYMVVDQDWVMLWDNSLERGLKYYHGTVVDHLTYETQPGNTGTTYLVRLGPP
jgi:hypothetical protein